MKNSLQINRRNRSHLRPWNDFDEMFERAFGNPLSFFEDMAPMSMRNEWMNPDYHIDENQDAYLVSIDLPGLKKEDVKVDLSENVLTISGERKSEREYAYGSSRSYGKFSRSFTLPGTVDSDKVEANLEDGVLRIALPKAENAKTRSIQIQSGKGGLFSKLIGSSKKEEREVKASETH